MNALERWEEAHADGEGAISRERFDGEKDSKL